MKYLFIGGGADGQWHEVDKALDFIKIAHPIDLVFNSLMAMVSDTRMESDVYKLTTWETGGEGIVRFYALEGLSPANSFRMLMNGYRRTV